MGQFNNKTFKYVICGVVIFLLGLFVGYQLNYGRLSSIQGYLFNAASEATNTNASDTNATSANASDANATSANASDANISHYDNQISLEKFELATGFANYGERVKVTIQTSGACNSAASIAFKNVAGSTFTVQVQDITGSPYIIVPDSLAYTEYFVTDVLLVGKNSDNSTFTKQYSSSEGENLYSFHSSLTISPEGVNYGDGDPVDINYLALSRDNAKVGDKVYVHISTSEPIRDLSLYFRSEEDNLFVAYVEDCETSSPYIEIPSSIISGTYSLTNAVLFSNNVTTYYSKEGSIGTLPYDFQTTLTISGGLSKVFIYENENINSEVIRKLSQSSSDIDIVVNTDANSIIRKELFDIIKGKNRRIFFNHGENQIIFDGRDVTDPQIIDVGILVQDVSQSQNIGALLSDGLVIHCPDSGDLPGRATIRLKATDRVTKVLHDLVHVYAYNEDTNDFRVIQTQNQKTDAGYYEFSIKGYADYVLVNEELDSKLVGEKQNDAPVVSFLKSNKTYLLLIGVAIVMIVMVTVIIFIFQKQKKQKSE